MFLSEDEYTYVLRVLDKKEKYNPLLDDFTQWMKMQLDIHMITYAMDTTNNGLIRLRIILWDQEEEKKLFSDFNYDKKKQLLIQKEFARLACKYACYPDYQKEEQIFVCADTLKDEIQKRIVNQEKVQVKLQDLKRKYDDIYEVVSSFGTIHIFYYTDEQIKEHEEDGFSLKLQKKCNKLVQKKDPYGVFNNGIACVFASKQLLDEHYDGNMYYYFK